LAERWESAIPLTGCAARAKLRLHTGPKRAASTVTVIDTTIDEVAGEIATGSNPRGFVAAISVWQRPGRRRSRRTGASSTSRVSARARCR
jgi:YVTN family beta-propeller protein